MFCIKLPLYHFAPAGAFAPRARAFHRAVTVQAVSELTVGQLKALFDGEDVITKAVLSKDSIQMVSAPR